ncbi:hypothetical protein PRUPE_2G287300 [Prunus persica]|uniref:Uncharacterized protein n=1 Tax=Prunus persica TaxID=3760 RepID=M5X1J6_PRUPE|nr:hypothetical protein PRUPE_2G287300 [Prunus persica]
MVEGTCNCNCNYNGYNSDIRTRTKQDQRIIQIILKKERKKESKNLQITKGWREGNGFPPLSSMSFLCHCCRGCQARTCHPPHFFTAPNLPRHPHPPGPIASHHVNHPCDPSPLSDPFLHAPYGAVLARN